MGFSLELQRTLSQGALAHLVIKIVLYLVPPSRGLATQPRTNDADQLTKSGVPDRTGGRSTRRGFSTSPIPSPAGSGSSRTRDASGSRSG